MKVEVPMKENDDHLEVAFLYGMNVMDAQWRLGKILCKFPYDFQICVKSRMVNV
jgi:hypothetical protein